MPALSTSLLYYLYCMKQLSFLLRIASWLLLLTAMVMYFTGYDQQAIVVIAIAVFCSAVVVAIQVSKWYHEYMMRKRERDI